MASLWQYQKFHREPKQRAKLVEQRQCPEDDGFLQRVAQRGHVPPYRWVPIGYRCIDCNTFYIHSEADI